LNKVQAGRLKKASNNNDFHRLTRYFDVSATTGHAVVATIDAGGGLEFGDTGGDGNFHVDGAEKN
jgi:hypothetical protein